MVAHLLRQALNQLFQEQKNHASLWVTKLCSMVHIKAKQNTHSIKLIQKTSLKARHTQYQLQQFMQQV